MSTCAVNEQLGVRGIASALLVAAEVLVAYLGEVEVPEPAVVEVGVSRALGRAGVQVQVQGSERTAREQAADLVAWSEALSSVSARGRRLRGSEVLVTVSGTVIRGGAEVPVEVYAVMPERGPFADLTEGAGRPSSVPEIQRWALGEPPLGSMVLTCPGCECTHEPAGADLDGGHTGCPHCGGPTLRAEIPGPG